MIYLNRRKTVLLLLFVFFVSLTNQQATTESNTEETVNDAEPVDNTQIEKPDPQDPPVVRNDDVSEAEEENEPIKKTSDLVILKANGRKMTIQTSDWNDTFSMRAIDLGKLERELHEYNTIEGNEIKMEVLSDMRVVMAKFNPDCRIPLLLVNYDHHAYVETVKNRVRIESDFFGFSDYNALNSDELLIYPGYKAEDFVGEPNLYEQQVILDNFMDKPIMITAVCIVFKDEQTRNFEFKMELKVAENAVQETFNMKKVREKDKTRILEHSFEVSPSTIHEIIFTGLADKTTIQIDEESSEFIDMSVLFKDSKDNDTEVEYIKSNEDYFTDIDTNEITVRIVNKTKVLNNKFSIRLTTVHNKILGLKKSSFLLILFLIIIIVILGILLIVCKYRKKNKKQRLKSKRKVSDDDIDLSYENVKVSIEGKQEKDRPYLKFNDKENRLELRKNSSDENEQPDRNLTDHNNTYDDMNDFEEEENPYGKFKSRTEGEIED